ncbi:AraC family transcriptional regulator [Mucilaginibacter rubeus]|uniref:AraC family transcriptional regulator n=2 Tax=Mucilaginibacter rubeus TaxID=2027860 RepID=A0A364WQK4_9SPHI|nr:MULTISPECIES: AraC family transcriptional regulator [Mucilaginibacter]QEM06112.1 AraC family transcriptional regulator [Mucilaginibacter rubeus]QEM13629.1 AraC family transcriptional regulator [Mucilaginibacter rubeus]QEM18692.1 AraC family transcriptional regulator [Mucilaginibacter gossypii]QTE36313.1 AraC family transcriptional regulator [Mucilaginibacter gossypii]QTE44766.1 helix-turn-helix domain-containing protein [Mucilaginibacter rubeus]
MPLFQDIEIISKEIHSSVSPIHRHHYFELLYIMEGNGVHTINDNHYQYQKGNLYLLTPEDTHTFKIETRTYCCIIDFTKELFSKRKRKEMDRAEIGEFFINMEYVFHNHQNTKGHIEMASEEAELTEKLVFQLTAEKEHDRIYSGIIIQNIVFLLLNLIARRIQENIAGELKNRGLKNVVHEVTTYVQQHIYDKDRLKIEMLAKAFHKTPDHLNRNFKQQTGYTLKAYINQYRLNLIESRLRYSSLTVSEIADEMGFTDESHLNKMFRNNHGQTASAYRKAHLS